MKNDKKFLIPLRGKRGKPTFSGNYWEVTFLLPPVVRVVFSFTNIPSSDYSICKVSVWDFYGKSVFQKRLLGEFLLDDTFPKLENKQDGTKLFLKCKKENYDYIKQQIQKIIDTAEGYVKFKWNKDEQAWYKIRIVNGKVRGRKKLDRYPTQATGF